MLMKNLTPVYELSERVYNFISIPNQNFRHHFDHTRIGVLLVKDDEHLFSHKDAHCAWSAPQPVR